MPKEMADPTDHVQLDWFESFCQFCMKLELVMIRDRKNPHSKNLTIENGIIRFHRIDLNPLEGAKTKNFHCHAFDEQERICWVDRKRTIGLKVKVRRLSALTGIPDYNQNGQAEQYEITLKGTYESEFDKLNPAKLIRTTLPNDSLPSWCRRRGRPWL